MQDSSQKSYFSAIGINLTHALYTYDTHFDFGEHMVDRNVMLNEGPGQYPIVVLD